MVGLQDAASTVSTNVPPEIFLKHYRAIRDAKRAHDETSMALARSKKQAKSDGVDLDAFKWLERLSKLDTDEAEAQLRHLQQYCAWLKMPIGTQLSMFAQEVADEPNDTAQAEQRAWAAEEAGYDAGKAGRHRVDDNPYPPGSEHAVRFDRGFMRGQKAIADKLGENAKQADARRGRKGGGDNTNGKAPQATKGRRGARKADGVTHEGPRLLS